MEDTYDLAKRLGYHAVKLDEPERIKVVDLRGVTVHIELWYYIADRNGKPASDNWQTESLAWEHIGVEESFLGLQDICDQMQAYVYSQTRPPADTLLLKALGLLADEENEALIHQIVLAYEQIRGNPKA